MTDGTKKTQLDKFKDAARELECDDDERRFKERVGKLVKAPVVDKSSPRGKKDSPTAD